MDKLELIVVGGKPYSGKSSISEGLVKKDKTGSIRHLSIGERLRGISSGKIKSIYSDVLKANADDLKKHAPVSKETSLGVFLEFVNEKPAKLILLDGYPRYLNRLEGFNQALKDINATIIAVCRVQVSDEVVHKRSLLREQRYKDTPEDRDFVEKRLNDFKNDSLTVLEILEKEYPSYVLNGLDPVEENITKLQKIYNSNSKLNKLF